MFDCSAVSTTILVGLVMARPDVGDDRRRESRAALQLGDSGAFWNAERGVYEVDKGSFERKAFGSRTMARPRSTTRWRCPTEVRAASGKVIRRQVQVAARASTCGRFSGAAGPAIFNRMDVAADAHRGLER